ncbi:4-hydroxybenzoate octaprenyltransferase [Pelagibacteraceae bacterium]|jgi:4-hydroxybenzoate polyprenyltransferase|nr:4-hydroxybenzoate octaprenyltransferase [Pelagibacteraceae bacterium]|tara:strand:+ start:1515 stop:2378 length:864 start_codon:yes stop_codon:yes gene_type:complete
MKQLKIFIELTRLDKPIGFMLLFWPCSWGLAYAFYFDQDLKKNLFFLLLFFLGSILMRSAGCIVNDIIDKDFDKKVERTKNRPLASDKISIKKSLLITLILCSIAFLILIQFNKITIMLGLASMTLAFSYPYMKRITYWPQLFLGLTFNWGVIMAWTSFNNLISFEILLLYISAIFWTLGYDTIYGAQDIAEDEIIGIKSTSIKFKENIKLFVSFCYLISSMFLFISIYSIMNVNYSIILFISYILSLGYQIKIFDKKKPTTCLKAFKINNLSGLLLYSTIMSLSLK